MDMLPLGEIREQTKLIKNMAANSCAKAAITPSTSIAALRSLRRSRDIVKGIDFLAQKICKDLDVPKP